MVSFYRERWWGKRAETDREREKGGWGLLSMYRVSREGRRSSAHEHDADSRPTRYKERFDDDACHDKNKGFGPAAGPAGVFPTRNPGAILCLKATAALFVLFFVRGVSVYCSPHHHTLYYIVDFFCCRSAAVPFRAEESLRLNPCFGFGLRLSIVV